MAARAQVITATPRQLESGVRLAESLARMRLSPTVNPSDVAEGLRLMQVPRPGPRSGPCSPALGPALHPCPPASCFTLGPSPLLALLRPLSHNYRGPRSGSREPRMQSGLTTKFCKRATVRSVGLPARPATPWAYVC